MKSLLNAKRGFTSIIAIFMLKKKDEAKQIVRNYIKFAQSQVWDFEMKSELYSAKLSGKDLHFLKILSVS